MPTEPVMLTSVLLQTSFLLTYVKAGLRAVHRTDRALFSDHAGRSVGDSLDLDEAARSVDPEENRWDYLLSVPSAGKIVALEPHSAKTSEVKVVIRKKQWALMFLRGHLPEGTTVSRWLWVSHGRASFSPIEKVRRRLNQAGIEFSGRNVRAL